jgi:hypothetical protein
MYGLDLCLPRVGQPQGLPVPHEIPKTRIDLSYYTNEDYPDGKVAIFMKRRLN